MGERKVRMNKQVFITNGMARCGKDTFANILNEFIPTLKYSSIDKVKEIASLCGWDGGKSEKDRKFLSDLKLLTTEYSNMPYLSIIKKYDEFLKDEEHKVLLIDIREPSEIDKAKAALNARTILIKNNRVKFVNSNMADANVFNYTYDYVIKNNGTLDEFRENIKRFYEENFC